MDEQPFTGDPLIDGGFETLCAHYGEHRLAHGGATAPPLYQTSNFIYPDAEAFERRLLPQSPYYDYTRVGNPTTAMLEAKLALLEHGHWGRGFASGMGAITAAINAFGWPAAMFSISTELIHSPPDLMTSLERSVMCR